MGQKHLVLIRAAHTEFGMKGEIGEVRVSLKGGRKGPMGGYKRVILTKSIGH